MAVNTITNIVIVSTITAKTLNKLYYGFIVNRLYNLIMVIILFALN